MKKYLNAFNSIVEIKTSIAIFTSSIIGSLYGYYYNSTFRWDLFFAILLCAVCLDAIATVFNHVYDYYKAIDKKGYLYTVHNPIVYYNVKPIYAVFIGFFLLGIAGISGLYLVIQTSYILFIIGIISALIAVLYSAGNISISYYPISELISGFFEGTVVIMIAAFLQMGSFTFLTFLISIPVALSISNIMLANNTTDIIEDKKNNRKTLPVLIGKRKAIILLIINTIMMVGLTLLYVFIDFLPVAFCLILLICPILYINLKRFISNPTKGRGFVYALKNSLVFNLSYILLFLLHLFYR